jgi:SAM-dependent methyltransferase
MEVDYVIVGCGLAGISFCEQLKANNKTFVVFDDKSQLSSTVAGGLYNPVVLKRFTSVWKSEEQIALALPVYQTIEKKLQVKLDYKLPVYRKFSSLEEQNDWFKSEFVDLRKGDAMDLPVEDNSIDVAAQNCLFNIFKEDDLQKAIAEMHRVLKPHGRLVMSDPTCEQEMSEELRNDERLRALCLSGSLSIANYVKALTDAGFGTIEIRARKPYRILDPKNYPTDELIYIESIEVAAIKDPMPEDGPCIFTGKAAIYYGDEDFFDDGKGHTLLKNQPLAICDKTAGALATLNRDDIFISESTFHYDGGGCC